MTALLSILMLILSCTVGILTAIFSPCIIREISRGKHRLKIPDIRPGKPAHPEDHMFI